MSEKRLIINADDFGMTESVNRGILDAFLAGPLTSTSIMANSNYFDHAASLAKENPNLGVGIHINLTQFAPLSGLDSTCALIGADGNFLGPRKFARKMILCQIPKESIRNEIIAQVQAVRNSGITIDHIDTHQHIHIFRRIFEILLEVAREFSIRSLRTTQEKQPPFPRALGKEGIKRLIFGMHTKQYRKQLNTHGLKTVQQFWGMDATVDQDPLGTWKRILQNLTPGSHELMCHPGYVDQNLREMDSYIERRKRELDALRSKDLATILHQENIQLIRYTDL